MKRIFAAVNLPKEVKEALAREQTEISGFFGQGFCPIKWVKADNLHITLLFLGEIKEDNVSLVIEASKKTIGQQKPFWIKGGSISAWPIKQREAPRLVWLSMERCPELEKISQNLGQTLKAEDLTRFLDEKPFMGHITIGRVKTWQWKQIDPEEIPEIAKDIDVSFEVKSIEIMESQLKRGGSEYKVLQSFVLV